MIALASENLLNSACGTMIVAFEFVSKIAADITGDEAWGPISAACPERVSRD